MLKKVISFVVGTACLVSMFGVSAATVDTQTIYDSGNIAVKSTVSGVANGDVVTYLAYDKAGLVDGADVVFVDKKTATGSNVSFEYVTSYSNVGSEVKVGGKASWGAGISAANTDIGIDVYYGGNLLQDVSCAVDATEDKSFVKIESPSLVGVAISGIAGDVSAVGDEDFLPGNGCFWIRKSIYDANDALTLTADNSAATGKTIAIAHKNDDPASVLAIGYVSGTVREFGIIFGTDATLTAAAADYSTHVEGTTATQLKFPALGRDFDGMYAVEVADYTDYFAGQEMRAAAYWVDALGATQVGATYTVSVVGSGIGGSVWANDGAMELDADDVVVVDDLVEDEVVVEIDIDGVDEVVDIDSIEE